VIPLAGVAGTPERFFLLLFGERAQPSTAEVAPARVRAPAPQHQPVQEPEELRRVRTELAATKDYLQSLISEHQSTTDELAAANEELVATNEELQSTNEELQSAKEELQSTNEELSTVNDQLRSRNQELDVIANDLVNVLESVQLPVIIVDMELKVRRFTPTVRDISSLIPGDVGRPLDDVKLKVRVDDLAERVKEVIGGMALKEWEVRGQDGRWFRLQIRPYRTADNRLDGAVLSFVDVDVLKRALTETEGARDYARRIVETVPTALVELGADLRVVSTNPRFRDRLALPAEAAEGKNFFELSAGAWDVPSLRRAVEEARTRSIPFANLGLTVVIPGIGRKVVSMTGHPIIGTLGAPMLLLAMEDITARRAFEEERAQLLASEKEARLESERANRTKDLFLASLSHELRSPLSHPHAVPVSEAIRNPGSLRGEVE
jgi:two-component system, chemotaxis family, CheB/CheR fusion protein